MTNSIPSSPRAPHPPRFREDVISKRLTSAGEKSIKASAKRCHDSLLELAMEDFNKELSNAAKRLGTEEAGKVAEVEITNGIAKISISTTKNTKTGQPAQISENVGHHPVDPSHDSFEVGKDSKHRTVLVPAGAISFVRSSKKLQEEEDSFWKDP
ncbi:hypothetical protein OCU04_012554 [Sclerotinia nivalis]|uniref:Uncharacterized protein n=1 Tax=Sclerotinia nivalis TaxID=352851 RepID=A0A9X0A955_9HELO|nr:hypothetical protein OCU04_012554 [Sclerotinia nivalis]